MTLVHLVQSIGWTLLHFIWQGAVLAALFAVAQFVLQNRSANARYVAGCVALVFAIILPVITFCIQAGEFSLRPTVTQTQQVQPTSGPAVELIPPMAAAAAVQVPVPEVQSRVGNVAKSPRTFDEQMQLALPWFVIAWLFGVSVLSIRFLTGWLYLRKLVRSGVADATGPLQKTLDDLKQRLRITRTVELLKSAMVEVPTVIGWIRPVILLPASSLIGLTPGQLEAILVHELAHIRRHDFVVNLLQSMLEILFFYHPAIWWISKKVRHEREHCCDDVAVELSGDAVSYARALATLEALRHGPALALAASDGSLLGRIQRLFNHPPEKGRRAGKWMSGALVLSVIVCAVFLLQGRAKEEYKSGAMDSWLASQPGLLRQLSTEKVIRIGINEPGSPWAWQELKKRAGDNEITAPQAELIMTGLFELMSEHPQYETQGKPLERIHHETIAPLHAKGLISEEKMVELAQAYHGDPLPLGLPRLRETDQTFWLVVQWKNDLDLFGFILLNEMRSVSINGQSVEVKSLFPTARVADYPEFQGTLQLPPLAPGKYILRCEISSLLVPAPTKMESREAFESWPAPRVQWMRATEAELFVYEKDAVIVRLIEDPALETSVKSGLSVGEITVGGAGKATKAVINFRLDKALNVPFGFNVALRIAGRTYEGGELYRTPTITIQSPSGPITSYRTSQLKQTILVEALDPDARTADVILTPNPRMMEKHPDVDRIWGKEIVFEKVPLVRRDEGNSEALSTADAPEQEQPPVLRFSLVAKEYELATTLDLMQDVAGQEYRVQRDVLLDESMVLKATTQQNPFSTNWEVEIYLTADGSKRFAEITKENIGNQLAIIFNNKLLTAPNIQGVIQGGRLQITGNFTHAEAEATANSIHEAASKAPGRPKELNAETQAFGIYLMKQPIDPRLAASGSGDWKSVPLMDDPIISDTDLHSYDWKEHRLHFRGPIRARLPRPPVQGLGFVVVVNGERIYPGLFTTSLSSFSFSLPNICVDRLDDPENTLTMDRAYPTAAFAKGPDPRGDARIQKALSDAGKLNGTGAAESEVMIDKELQTKAEAGDRDAQVTLGAQYRGKDPVKAFKWNSKAAEQGSVSAQYLVAGAYELGRGVRQDYTQSVHWYRKAAETPEPDAHPVALRGIRMAASEKLGNFYAEGLGVARNYGQAAQWYRKAADGTFPGAQASLGQLYVKGLGVPQDHGEAFQLLRRAAERYQVKAQYYLGLLYAEGEGVPKDQVLAYKWLTLAEELSPPDGEFAKASTEARRTLGEQMNPEQMIKARDLAGKFRQRTRDQSATSLEEWLKVGEQLSAGNITEAEANRLFDGILQREIERTDAEYSKPNAP
ncbi:MAG: SEL1-like repeat protein [Verrucomicrobia bacterium]|nr:SEL1-like repeat protein [Verrucomicrobiota bacterium]